MAANDTWTSGAVGLQHGEYRYGSPLDGVHYLECKLILKPDRFTCVQDFHEYGSIVREAAQQCEAGFSTKHMAQPKPRIREVLFLDTDFTTMLSYCGGAPLTKTGSRWVIRKSSSSSGTRICTRPQRSTSGQRSRAATRSSSRQKPYHCAISSAGTASSILIMCNLDSARRPRATRHQC